MNLNKSLEMSNLFTFYGKLLTKKQQDIFLEYYFNNLSLSEVAEAFSISRQAVLDSLQKSEKQLLHFEEELGLGVKFNSLKQTIAGLEEDAKKSNFNEKQVLNALKKLLEGWEGN